MAQHGVSTLQELSQEKFAHACNTCRDIDDYPHAITAVYDLFQMARLRDIVARTSYAHLGTLMWKDEFLHALESTEGFAGGILRLQV